MTIQALINSISLSELKNIQLLHLRAAFNTSHPYLSVVFGFTATVPPQGEKLRYKSPRALKKKSRHKTILLSHECGTQSKLP